MADYSREELLQMLEETEPQQQARTVEVRGVTVTINDGALKSWPVLRKVSALTDMDGLRATVALMDVVTMTTDLTEDAVLDMAGGHMADFADVAEVLSEISAAVYPKA